MRAYSSAVRISWALATGLPKSPTESAFLLTIVDAGFPRPVCQYEVGRDRFDFAWPDQRVALEHVANIDKDRTMPTINTTHQGWLVIRADTQDLADPTALYGRLRTALQTRTYAAA